MGSHSGQASQSPPGPVRAKETQGHLPHLGPPHLKPHKGHRTNTHCLAPVSQATVSFLQWLCRGGFPKTTPSLGDSLVYCLPHCTPPPPQPSLGPCNPKTPGRRRDSHGESQSVAAGPGPALSGFSALPTGACQLMSLLCHPCALPGSHPCKAPG